MSVLVWMLDVAEAVERTVAEVIIAVFDAANPVVGEGVFGARSDGPAGKILVRVEADVIKEVGFGGQLGKGYAAGGKNKGAVERIAYTAPQRSQIVAADIHVEAIDVEGLVVPDPVEVAFRTEHPCAGLPVVAGIAAEEAAVEVVREHAGVGSFD